MTISVHVAGATKAVAAAAFRDADNVSRVVALGKIRDAGNVSRTIFSALASAGSGSIALSTTSVFGHVNTGISVAVQTGEVTATPSGGVEPYTYLWTRTDSALGTWSITAPTSPATRFFGGNCGPGDALNATFHCTVTDAAGNTAVSGDVAAYVSNIGFNVSGGGGPLP
jgi:hypothetical protein